MMVRRRVMMSKTVFCTILAEEKMRYHDKELLTDPSSGKYNLEHHDAYGGGELEMIAVSKKPFRELSFNPNIRTNLEPEDDREVMRRIVCVKLKDDIHNPKNKMTSNSKWIWTGVKEKGDLEEDS